MKRYLLILSVLFLLPSFTSGDEVNYKSGEYLQYRIHYGLINAGFASLEVSDVNYAGRPHYHMVGKGSSSGAVRMLFPVDDLYETYIDAATQLPTQFIRNIDEGGYKRHQIMNFNHNKKVAEINDRIKNKKTYINFQKETQDLISAFYRLRNFDTDNLQTGDVINLDILLADGVYGFQLKVLGREVKKTKFGKINTIKFRPYVQSGRVFKAKESVTMWVTDDKNHVPVQVKAELAVGSLKADIHDFRNVKYPLKFQ